MKMLIVEDSSTYAELVQRFNPCDACVIAENMERAVELLKGQEWDVVWLDKKFPGSPETPEKLVALVRAYSKDAAVILVSGFIERGDSFGADAVAHKDDLILPEQMQDLIAEGIAHRKKKPAYEKSVESVTALVKTEAGP